MVYGRLVKRRLVNGQLIKDGWSRLIGQVDGSSADSCDQTPLERRNKRDTL